MEMERIVSHDCIEVRNSNSSMKYNGIKYPRYGDRIHTQLKRLGASYDWDRAVFTMDPVRMLCIFRGCLYS